MLQGRKVVLDSCTVMAQRQYRSRRVFYTIEEKPDRAVQWDPVDNQLEEWAEKFPGKKFHLDIVWQYRMDGYNASHVTPETQPNTVGGSATANTLGGLENEPRGKREKGVANVWQQIYSLWRCWASSCSNVDGACWRNPAQQHFKLLVSDISEWHDAIIREVKALRQTVPHGPSSTSLKARPPTQ